MGTGIEWCDETVNMLVGCTKVSPGCRNCYAERMAVRLQAMGLEQYQGVVDEKGRWTGKIGVAPEKVWDKVRGWKTGKRVFINSMSDLFHPHVDDDMLGAVLGRLRECPQHQFITLTKRAERMEESSRRHNFPRNLVVGVTAEDQVRADARLPYLLRAKVWRRLVSVEPMLGPVYLGSKATGLDWVICGGESGPGARPMEVAWVRGVLNTCQTWAVPFFFKQWGDAGAERGPAVLDGREWKEFVEWA